jgi:predicted metal-dependent TIM-barrel fold hydrolase
MTLNDNYTEKSSQPWALPSLYMTMEKRRIKCEIIRLIPSENALHKKNL